jgi:hypothetical protein
MKKENIFGTSKFQNLSLESWPFFTQVRKIRLESFKRLKAERMIQFSVALNTAISTTVSRHIINGIEIDRKSERMLGAMMVPRSRNPDEQLSNTLYV